MPCKHQRKNLGKNNTKQTIPQWKQHNKQILANSCIYLLVLHSYPMDCWQIIFKALITNHNIFELTCFTLLKLNNIYKKYENLI